MPKDHAIDGLEVFVKVKMGLSLTDGELEIFNCYDQEEKQLIFDFINNPAFVDDLILITTKINREEDNIRKR